MPNPFPARIVEAVARAQRYYFRMWEEPHLYAVCDADLKWGATPIRSGLSLDNARGLTRDMNARAAILATIEQLKQPSEEMRSDAVEAMIEALDTYIDQVRARHGDDAINTLTIVCNSGVTDAINSAMLDAAKREVEEDA